MDSHNSADLANQEGGLQRWAHMAALRFPTVGSDCTADSSAVHILRLPFPRITVSSPAGSLPLAADCFISRLHLHDFVDGELDTDVPGSALREIILGHLVHCPRCARLEQQLRGMRTRLRQCAERTQQQIEERPSDEFRARMARLLAG